MMSAEAASCRPAAHISGNANDKPYAANSLIKEIICHESKKSVTKGKIYYEK